MEASRVVVHTPTVDVLGAYEAMTVELLIQYTHNTGLH